jgi:hypothetical protein
MKKIISLIIIITLLISVFAFAEATQVQEERTPEEIKELYELRIREISRMEDKEEALIELNRLKLQLEGETILSEIDLFDLNVEIENTEEILREEIARESVPYTETELERLTRVEYESDSFYIYFPKLNNNQEYEYIIYEEGKTIKDGTTSSHVKLPDISEESSFEVEVKIIDEDYGTMLTATFEIEIEDDVLPELIYAYIEDGEVFMKFDDNYRLNGTFSTGDDEEIRVRNNRFEVDIPAEVNISIISPFGTEKEFNLNITKDNYVILGEVSERTREKLENKRMTELKKYDSIDNLFVGDKFKTVDLREESEKLIDNKYDKYNEEDISFSSDGIDIRGDLGDLTKAGINTVKINHSFFNKENLSFFVYVKEDKFVNTNIDKVKIKGKVITNKKTFTPKNYIEIEEKIEGYEPKLDFLFIVKDDIAYKISEEMKLEEGIMNKFKIINVLTGDEHILNLKYQEEDFEDKPVSFNDVDGSHWAYHDIKELAFAGLANGYEDGSYKPDRNITIREFMTLLNRFTSKANVEVESFNNEAHIPLSENDWAYLDVFSVYRRIKEDDLNKFSLNNINRKITRGEVAFLIDTSLKIESENKDFFLKDINSSIYAKHIYNLSNAEIINGYPDKTFKPLNNITRAEVSSMFNKLLKENRGGI